MKWIYILFIAQFLLSLTIANTSANNNNSRCIRMTKKAEAEIEMMINKIGNFVTSLADDHYKFAITFVKFNIGPKNGTDDDEIRVDVTINDCGEEQESVNEEDEEEEYEFVVDAHKYPNTPENVKDKSNVKCPQNCEKCKTDEAKPIAKENQNGGTWDKPLMRSGKAELMMLDVDGVPLPLLNKIDKKRGKTPLLVYIQQRSNNQTDYIFLNRK